MQIQNYYKLSDSLNGVIMPGMSGGETETVDQLCESPETQKPYLISYTKASNFVKAFLLLLMFSSFFFLGLNAQTVLTVGGSGGADYSTLKSAFDDINAGAVTGDIELHLISNTTEASTAVLNASGGMSSYSSILIKPDNSQSIVIGGNLSGGLINLNGATNVTIDGINISGDSLLLENTHTSGPTVLFTNSANNNTLTRLSILGAVTSTTSGVISFTSASVSLAYGNNNNTISNCLISKARNGNNPLNAIFSSGTASKPNINMVSDCRISDFQSSTNTQSGIKLLANNESWTITNNKIYKTASSVISASSVAVYGIYINDGGAYTITGNTIGYGSDNSSGYFTYTVANSLYTFCGIYVRSTITNNSVVSNNQIKNIEIDASANDFTYYGIYFDGTASPIDLTVENNSIGSLTDANSLVLKTTGRLDLNCISFKGSSNNYQVQLNSNHIGSINSSAVAIGSLYSSMMYFEGSASSSFFVNSNVIGAADNGKISLGTVSATGDYKIYGINLENSGSMELNNNTICHIYENSTGTTDPWIYGIYVNFAGGTLTTNKIISGNTIHDIISYSGYSVSGSRVASGILIESGNNSYTLMVNDNTIYNIKYLGSTSVDCNVSGIGIPCTTQKMKIFNNVIYGIENNSTYSWSSNLTDRGGISGIEMNNSTNTTNLVEIYNNRIFLKADNGGNPTCVPIKGIEVHSLATVYYNTVVISGSACSSGGNTISTTCLTGGQYLEIPVYNNVFCNIRTGNGNHYAIANDGYNAYSAANYTFFTDNNVYHTSNPSTMAKWSSSDQTFAQWQSSVFNSGIGPNVDINSLNTDPLLADISVIDMWYAGSTASPIRNAGVVVAGITDDCLGNIRNGSQPYIGAMEKIINIWEGTFSDDWGTAANWYSGTLPLAGESIYFSATPLNNLVLDGHKVIENLENLQPLYDLLVNGYTLTIKGDINAVGGAEIDASANNSVVILNGTSQQNIPTGSFLNGEFYNITINNPAGVVFNENITVSGTLTMQSGDLNMNSFEITLGTSASNTGTLVYSSGLVNGLMTRWFAASTNSGNSGLFPLGSDGNDRFVTVEYTTAPAVGGTLTASVNTGDMGTAGLPINGISAVGSCSTFDLVHTSDNGYWVIDAANGLNGGAYSITLVGEGISGANNLCELTAIKRVSMGNWFESGVHQPVSGTIERPVVQRTDASGWSNWGFGGGALTPLPLDLLSLNARCSEGKNIVNWKTASENNISHFEIEKSADGRNWISAGKVYANNSGNNVNAYTFSDPEGNTNGMFYRIVIHESNLSVSYSHLVMTECGVSDSRLFSVYPNPAGNEINVNSEESIGLIEILDVTGKQILSFYTEDTGFSCNLADLNPGVYLLKTGAGQIRFVKN